MPAAVGVVGGYPHEPVNAGLSLEISEGPLPLHFDGSALDPRGLVGEDIDDPCPEALLLRPPEIHAKQHFSPVLGLEPPRTGVNLQKCALGVVTPGENMGLFDSAEVLVQSGDSFPDVRRNRLLVFFCQIQKNLEIVPEGRNLFPAVEDIGDAGLFRLDFARLYRIFPDAGIGELCLQFFQTLFPAGYLKDNLVRVRAFPQ